MPDLHILSDLVTMFFGNGPKRDLKNMIFLALFVPIDHHAIFKMFKLSFCGSKKNSNKYFFQRLLGHFQKSVTGSESMCRSVMASSFHR